MLDRLRRIGALDRPIWIYAGLVVVALAFGLPLVRRAIILSDEGYLLQQSLDLLQGRVIYRDMDAFITPGAWFLLAGVFALFGPSVIVSRYVVLIAYVALCLVSFRIVERQAGLRWGLAAVASILLGSVWAFPAWTFAFYSPFSVLFALIALERLLAWHRGRAARDLWLVGLLLGLAICFKQNYGVFALLGASIGYAAMRAETRRMGSADGSSTARDVARVGGGVLVAGLPFLVYLVWHGAIPHAWQSLVVHPFEFGGRHDIPYASLSDLWRADLYQTATLKLTYLSYAQLKAPIIGFLLPLRIVHRLHVLAYWLAPMVFLAGLSFGLTKGRRPDGGIDAALLATTSVCGLLFLGVFPRADFNHLANVYQGVLVTAPVVLHHALDRVGSNRTKTRGFIALGAGIVALAYGGVAFHWYVSLIRTHATPIDSPRAGILIEAPMANELDYQLGAISRRAKAGEAVLTVPDLVMLNFLADRPVPSPYYNLYEHHIAGDGGRAVIEAVESKQVQLVVTRYDNFFSDRVGLLEYAPELASYIITHFERSMVGGNESFIVYSRRESPEPEQPFVDVFERCEHSDELGEVREHLLFSSLYHRSQARRPMPQAGLQTRCRVRVPDEGGTLSLEIGYRRPYLVASGTTLRARIRALPVGPDAEAQATGGALLDQQLRVIRRGTTQIEQPYKFVEIDLSAFAGSEIDLVFEAGLTGQVHSHPRDYKGFALVWRNARIQVTAGGARP